MSGFLQLVDCDLFISFCAGKCLLVHLLCFALVFCLKFGTMVSGFFFSPEDLFPLLHVFLVIRRGQPVGFLSCRRFLTLFRPKSSVCCRFASSISDILLMSVLLTSSICLVLCMTLYFVSWPELVALLFFSQGVDNVLLFDISHSLENFK